MIASRWSGFSSDRWNSAQALLRLEWRDYPVIPSGSPQMEAFSICGAAVSHQTLFSRKLRSFTHAPGRLPG
jgi:hypothetical protein